METNSNQSSSTVTKVVIAIVAILLCCACVVIIAAGVIIYRHPSKFQQIFLTIIQPTNLPPHYPSPPLTVHQQIRFHREHLKR